MQAVAADRRVPGNFLRLAENFIRHSAWHGSDEVLDNSFSGPAKPARGRERSVFCFGVQVNALLGVSQDGMGRLTLVVLVQHFMKILNTAS